jgi:alkanesulfonate monooxygenase SsuD/methylene tetrahydromethanopterin reductase-like flavin-dependent oxidoreductase (luciferase family)
MSDPGSAGIGAPTATTPHPWVHDGATQIRAGVFGGPIRHPDRLRRFLTACEDLECDSYWTFDHPLLNPDWATTLAAAGAWTKRMRLGALVACPSYRHPALIARQGADVDRISGGRFVLGLGAGDAEDEFDALGIPFGSRPERFERMASSVSAIRALWEGRTVTGPAGRERLLEASLEAPPVQDPFVPILIAGAADRVLSLAATMGDAVNVGAYRAAGAVATPPQARERMERLDALCRDAGRDPSAVLRTHVTLRATLAPTTASLDRKLRSLPKQLLEEHHLVDGLMATP